MAIEMKMWIDHAKLFLFLFDGNIGFRNGTMGTNFVGKLVVEFSMHNTHGSLFMQAFVGLFDP